MNIAEYAEAHGLSERTVRRRIQRGQLHATLTAGPYGPEYQIVEGDSTAAGDPPPTRRAPSPDKEQGPSLDDDGGDSPDGWLGSPDSGLGELVGLLRDLNQQVIELSGRCGWLQSENQRLLADLGAARDRIALLEAPAPAPVENGHDSGVQRARSTPDRPWWAFWRAWGQQTA